MSPPLRGALIVVACLSVTGCRDEPKRVSSNAAREALSSENVQHVPAWARSERLPKRAVAGARLFALSGCTNCHTYLGVGARNVGGRDLSRAGLRHGQRYFERYVAQPGRFGNGVMPPFSALGARKLRQLSVFLASSKGAR